MSSNYAVMIGMVSVITLVPLLLLFARDKRENQMWSGLAKPVTLREVFRDWIAYVLIFTILLLTLRGLLCLLCSYCESC
ncbi:MAG: hypothetical protein K0S45_3365 [Nitrospira sp.]|jgi:hypothetical protein|nr:hypothetical protein [Nitrospira sp.]